MVTLIQPFYQEVDGVHWGTKGDYLQFLFSPKIDLCEFWADINDGRYLDLSCSLWCRVLSEIDRTLCLAFALCPFAFFFFQDPEVFFFLSHILWKPTLWPLYSCVIFATLFTSLLPRAGDQHDPLFSQPDCPLWSFSFSLSLSMYLSSSLFSLLIHVGVNEKSLVGFCIEP